MASTPVEKEIQIRAYWRMAIICLSSSAIILVLLAMLEFSSRKKLHAQIAGVTIVGAAGSLAFGLIGVAAALGALRTPSGSLRGDEENGGLLIRGLAGSESRDPRWWSLRRHSSLQAIAVGSTFTLICFGNGALLASSLEVAILAVG